MVLKLGSPVDESYCPSFRYLCICKSISLRNIRLLPRKQVTKFLVLVQFSADCLWAESFAMGKLHKDIAMAMVQLAEEESTTDQDIIKVSKSNLGQCGALFKEQPNTQAKWWSRKRAVSWKRVCLHGIVKGKVSGKRLPWKRCGLESGWFSSGPALLKGPAAVVHVYSIVVHTYSMVSIAGSHCKGSLTV